MTIRGHSHEALLSKADLREFELRLEARFSQLEQALEQKIGGAQSGLTKWFTGIAVAQAAVIVALVKLLPGPS
ncbi:MAG: hypothetical protein ACREH3_03055 [Geminicoccales bacterium]